MRRDRGLAQVELAQLTGYSTQHVSAVERGAVAASEQFVAACDSSLGADGHLVRLFESAIREQAAVRHRRQAARRPAALQASGTVEALDVDWERLEATVSARVRPSAAVVHDLAMITNRHRSLYHLLPPAQMIGSAAAHLSALRAVLDVAPDDGMVRDVAAMAQETAGLVAWLRHDLAELAASEAAYRLADQLLDASGDRQLAGYVTGFRAIARAARGDQSAGARDLDVAADQLGRAAPPMPAAWLLALRAEAEARRRNEGASLALLGAADRELDRADGDPGVEWMYLFDHGRLAAHRGVCFLELEHLDGAEAAFEQALQTLTSPRPRRGSELKAQLALVQVARGDCRGAAALCSEALDGFVAAGSIRG